MPFVKKNCLVIPFAQMREAWSCGMSIGFEFKTDGSWQTIIRSDLVGFGPGLRHHVYSCQGCVAFGGSPSLRANGSCPRAYEVCDGSASGGFVSAFAALFRHPLQRDRESDLCKGCSSAGHFFFVFIPMPYSHPTHPFTALHRDSRDKYERTGLCACTGHEAGWVCGCNYRAPVTEAAIEQWRHEHTLNTVQEAANGSKMCSCWWFSDKKETLICLSISTDLLFRVVFLSVLCCGPMHFQCPFVVKSVRIWRESREVAKAERVLLRVLLVGEVLHHFNCTLKITLLLPPYHWCCLWLLAQKRLNDQNPAPPQW